MQVGISGDFTLWRCHYHYQIILKCYFALPDWVVLFILRGQEHEEVSFIALKMDKKSEIERNSVRYNLVEGQKERAKRESFRHSHMTNRKSENKRKSVHHSMMTYHRCENKRYSVSHTRGNGHNLEVQAVNIYIKFGKKKEMARRCRILFN